MRTTILVSFLLAFLLAPAALLADEAADGLIARGDKFYENRGKGTKWCVKALECYEKALAVDAENVAASWKFARASYWLGSHTEGEEAQIEIFKKGIDVAKRAVAIDDKSVESHFWLGVSYGKYGEAKGVMNSLALVDPIQKEMERVLELDENFDAGGAHRVLGRMYFKLPGIAGGSNEKAVEHLLKAIAIDKTRLLNHLFLAEVYIAEDEKEKAKAELTFVIDAEFEADRKPENEEEKAQAKELLKEMEG